MIEILVGDGEVERLVWGILCEAEDMPLGKAIDYEFDWGWEEELKKTVIDILSSLDLGLPIACVAETYKRIMGKYSVGE